MTADPAGPVLAEPPLSAGRPEDGGLAIENVTVTYRNGHTALYKTSFAIPKGTITALVGINGSGKSTLFKAVMGFVPVSEGSVRVLGMAAQEALSRNLVSYVPQSEEVDWNFPVLVQDVVMMGRYGRMNWLRRPSRRDRELVDAALERVDMTAYRDRQIGELSGGQKKRVFLARALAQEGMVILLDEPFTGVDVRTEEQIITLLQALRDEGRVMLVSTHNLGSVPEFCDRAVLINRTILASGHTGDVFTRANLEKAFGGVLRQFTLEATDLHADDDPRRVTVLTDDERPFVIYGEEGQSKSGGTGSREP
jgi:manganese/iron transport system ATP-binding protein